MSNIEIVRMWGRADEFEVEFVKTTSGLWKANVPPDLRDGQYAVEIHAFAENGYVCLWTGILYMNQGQTCLHIRDSKYSVWMRIPETTINELGTESDIISLDRYCDVVLQQPKYIMYLRRCCMA